MHSVTTMFGYLSDPPTDATDRDLIRRCTSHTPFDDGDRLDYAHHLPARLTHNLADRSAAIKRAELTGFLIANRIHPMKAVRVKE